MLAASTASGARQAGKAAMDEEGEREGEMKVFFSIRIEDAMEEQRRGIYIEAKNVSFQLPFSVLVL